MESSAEKAHSNGIEKQSTFSETRPVFRMSRMGSVSCEDFELSSSEVKKGGEKSAQKSNRKSASLGNLLNKPAFMGRWHVEIEKLAKIQPITFSGFTERRKSMSLDRSLRKTSKEVKTGSLKRFESRGRMRPLKIDDNRKSTSLDNLLSASPQQDKRSPLEKQKTIVDFEEKTNSNFDDEKSTSLGELLTVNTDGKSKTSSEARRKSNSLDNLLSSPAMNCETINDLDPFTDKDFFRHVRNASSSSCLLDRKSLRRHSNLSIDEDGERSFESDATAILQKLNAVEIGRGSSETAVLQRKSCSLDNRIRTNIINPASGDSEAYNHRKSFSLDNRKGSIVNEDMHHKSRSEENLLAPQNRQRARTVNGQELGRTRVDPRILIMKRVKKRPLPLATPRRSVSVSGLPSKNDFQPRKNVTDTKEYKDIYTNNLRLYSSLITKQLASSGSISRSMVDFRMTSPQNSSSGKMNPNRRWRVLRDSAALDCSNENENKESPIESANRKGRSWSSKDRRNSADLTSKSTTSLKNNLSVDINNNSSISIRNFVKQFSSNLPTKYDHEIDCELDKKREIEKESITREARLYTKNALIRSRLGLERCKLHYEQIQAFDELFHMLTMFIQKEKSFNGEIPQPS